VALRHQRHRRVEGGYVGPERRRNPPVVTKGRVADLYAVTDANSEAYRFIKSPLVLAVNIVVTSRCVPLNPLCKG
jgi:hypothetical protein